MERIRTTLDASLKASGARGSVSELTANHAGFSRGGIDVTFTYSEKVGSATISVPVRDVEFSDDGAVFHTDGPSGTDIENAIVAMQPHRYRPGYQPLRDQYTRAVRDALSGEGRLVIDEDFFGFQDEPRRASRTDEDQQWFTTTAEQNRASNNPDDRAFFGHYNIPADDAFQHTDFTLAFTDESRATRAASDTALDGHCGDIPRIIGEDWDEARGKVVRLDSKTAPNARYKVLISYADEYRDESERFQLGAQVHAPLSSLLQHDCRPHPAA